MSNFLYEFKSTFFTTNRFNRMLVFSSSTFLCVFVSFNSGICKIVRENEGTMVRNNGRFGERTKVEFLNLELIITGNNITGDNKRLNYAISPQNISSFIEKNRRWLKEVSAFNLEFDKTGEEKTEEFKIKAALKKQGKDDVKIIDYVRIHALSYFLVTLICWHRGKTDLTFSFLMIYRKTDSAPVGVASFTL